MVENDSAHLKATQIPVSNMLNKAEKVNMRKEYEVETTNGRTITKKTRTTGLFGEPRRGGKRMTPIATTPGIAAKASKMRMDIMFCFLCDSGGKRMTPIATTPGIAAKEPMKAVRRRTPMATTPGIAAKHNKGGGGTYPNPVNVGDLFSEGSLNPYADDPYAFD